MTKSIKAFLAASHYRREKQLKHNEENNITPQSVSRAVEDSLGNRQEATDKATMLLRDAGGEYDVTETIRELEQDMLAAAENLEFEKAAHLRDQVKMLNKELETKFQDRSTGASAINRFTQTISSITYRHNCSGGIAYTCSMLAECVSHELRFISSSNWPAPQPEYPAKMRTWDVGENEFPISKSSSIECSRFKLGITLASGR